MNRWILGVVASVGCVGAIVGCGGGDDSTTASVTKAAFTKQADAICAEGKEKREAAAAETDQRYYELEGKAENPDQQVANVPLERRLAEEMVDNSIVPAMKEQLADFEELGVPEGDDAEVEAIVESYAAATDEVEKGGLKALVGFEGVADFQEAAGAYGLDCNF